MASKYVLKMLITPLTEDHNGGQYCRALKQGVTAIDLDIE